MDTPKDTPGAPRQPDYQSVPRRQTGWVRDFRKWLAWEMVRLMVALASRFPVRAMQRLGAVLGRLGYHLERRERTLAHYHLGLVLPEVPEAERTRIARACFASMGTAVCELLVMPRLRLQSERWVHLENEQALVEAHALGKGVILVTGHLGNWEMLPIALGRLHIHAVAVARSLPDPRMNELVQTLRRFEYMEIAERGSQASPRLLLSSLKSGKALIMVNDVDIDAQGVFVDFFGIPANTPRAPASLALKTGAPVVMFFDTRHADGTHTLRFQSVPVTEAMREAERPIEALTQELSDRTEAAIRANPEQWVWNHQRWRRRPPTEQETPKGQPNQAL